MYPVNSYLGLGEQVVSIANHPPEVYSGTRARIVSQIYGTLYAVKLPDGELHRWFAQPELQSESGNNLLQVGSYARIIDNEGHPPKIYKGMLAQIIKVVPNIYFYDLILESGKYHRWLADFELANPI